MAELADHEITERLMSRLDNTQRLLPSLLDRLIDPESGGTAWQQGYSVIQMIEAVRRDLEDLLNTRRTSVGIDERYKETIDSIVAFGLPDLVSVDASAMGTKEKIGDMIEATIRRFEPRLKDVRARLVESRAGETDRSLKFDIQARLAVDPSPEIGFETVLELMTGHASIKQQKA
jgi:type VI secretion system protein ImpF